MKSLNETWFIVEAGDSENVMTSPFSLQVTPEGMIWTQFRRV
jgi:hypothetical protein